VATNAHIAGVSPCQIKVTFENGERCEARILYTDDWHDFAFVKLSLEEVEWPLVEAKMGASFALREQQEVCMIGNNDCEEYSVKFGVVTSLAVNRGDNHSDSFQTSFDRTGGSSGSPVFNDHGVVVGLHMSGTDTTSIELRIEYLKDALEQIRRVGTEGFKRGTIGIELDLGRISTVVKHCKFPKPLVEELRSNWSEIKHVLTVDRTVPKGNSEKFLRPADVIYKINNTLIGNNLYLFDKLVDESVGSPVTLVVYRNGVEHSFQIEVQDVEKMKVRKFALFAGGVFHDLIPRLRSRFAIHSEGVFLGQVTKGSSLADLGEGTDEHPTGYIVVLEEFHGIKTRSLEEFISAVKEIGNTKDTYALSRNLRSFSAALLSSFVTLTLKFEPLRVFVWDTEKLEWMEQDTPDGPKPLEQPSGSDSESDADDGTSKDDSSDKDEDFSTL